MSQFRVEWVDGQREPTEAPNPRFPNGRACVIPGKPACVADLPYPAKRCGAYVVTCTKCDIRVGVTTAGRPDDPRSIAIPCKIGRLAALFAIKA